MQQAQETQEKTKELALEKAMKDYRDLLCDSGFVFFESGGIDWSNEYDEELMRFHFLTSKMCFKSIVEWAQSTKDGIVTLTTVENQDQDQDKVKLISLESAIAAFEVVEQQAKGLVALLEYKLNNESKND